MPIFIKISKMSKKKNIRDSGLNTSKKKIGIAGSRHLTSSEEDVKLVKIPVGGQHINSIPQRATAFLSKKSVKDFLDKNAESPVTKGRSISGAVLLSSTELGVYIKKVNYRKRDRSGGGTTTVGPSNSNKKLTI